MKVFIIEKDINIINEFEIQLKKIDTNIEIIGKVDTITDDLQHWTGLQPDIIFIDIELTKDMSIEIFEQIIVNRPIVFTANNEDNETINAFEINNVDYLLKPVVYEDLKNIIYKFKELNPLQTSINNPSTDVLDNVMKILYKEFKKRFIVKTSDGIRNISVNDIYYFYVNDNKTFIHTRDNKDFIIDYSLDLLEKLINPELFLRINNNYIINIHSFIDIIIHSDELFEIIPHHKTGEKIIIQSDKIQAFKDWIDR
ncbi:MAG: LytTR family transcriptional regulator DNA-binding domain-containing protein [Bacteroidales bacterium]|nr:LytTR family transcriptional regulator DNA-binding domain-containing protein [Bacteroidales bacterium]